MRKEQFNEMKNHKTIRLVDFKSPQGRPIDDVKQAVRYTELCLHILGWRYKSELTAY